MTDLLIYQKGRPRSRTPTRRLTLTKAKVRCAALSLSLAEAAAGVPFAGGFVRGSVDGCAANIAEADPILAYRLAALRLAGPQFANHVTSTQDQRHVLLCVLTVCAGKHPRRRQRVAVVRTVSLRTVASCNSKEHVASCSLHVCCFQCSPRSQAAGQLTLASRTTHA